MLRRFILIILAINTFGIYSSEKLISRIDIEGLKRTRESVVTELLEVEEGDKISQFNQDDFSQKVLKTGVLQKPEISIIEDGEMVVIKIDVKDKWTLIPAPMVSISSEDQSYGVLLYESNFLGLRKSFFTSCNYSTKDGISGDISYQESNLIPGRLRGRLGFGFGSSSDNIYVDFTNREEGKYSLLKLYGKGGLTYKLNEQNSIGISETYKYYDVDDNSAKPIESLDISQYFNTTLLLSGDYQRYSSTINTGLYYFAYYTLGYESYKGDFYNNLNMEIKYAHNIVSDLYIRGGASILLFDKPFLQEEYWGSDNYSRAIPASKHDIHFASALELEHEVLKFKLVSFSYLVHFEGGIYNRDNENRVYYGPSAGIRMYFPWLSVPAMGIDYGYNLGDGTPNFSFTIAF